MERRDLPSALAPGAAPAGRSGVVVSGTVLPDFGRGLNDVAANGRVVGSRPSSTAAGRPAAPTAEGAARKLDPPVAVTVAFMRVADVVLARLSRFEPPVRPAAAQARHELVRLISRSRTHPSDVLAARSIVPLESVLDRSGPSDPFASLPVVPTAALEPGDLIVRCTPGVGSQALEAATWSRYSHVALYVGDGRIIDATAGGVRIRALSQLLAESNRVGVLRVPGLTPARAQAAIRAAESYEGAGYNFAGVEALAGRKLARVTGRAGRGMGVMVAALSQAERLPARFADDRTFGCSQLVRVAFAKAGVVLSGANGLAPGDVVRMGTAGLLEEIGRLALPAPASPVAGDWLP